MSDRPSDPRTSMNADDIERAAHYVRSQIQELTCCPQHAGEVLMLVLAGFALDEADDNPHEAAQTIMKGARQWSKAVRERKFVVLRNKQ